VTTAVRSGYFSTTGADAGQQESNSINLVEDCGNGAFANPTADEPH
jgi:hypothetical protein